MTPKKLYRIDNLDTKMGIWRNFDGEFSPIFSQLTVGKCRNLPMEDNPIYRARGKRWFASAPTKYALTAWFCKQDILELMDMGFEIREYEATQYKTVSPLETIFTMESVKHTRIVDINDIFKN